MKLHPALDARSLPARAPSKFEDGTERGLEQGGRIMFRSATDSFALREDGALASALRSGTLTDETPALAALGARGVLVETPVTWSQDMLVQSFDLARRAFQGVLGDSPQDICAATLARPVFAIVGQGRVADAVARLSREIGVTIAAGDTAENGAEGGETPDGETRPVTAVMVCSDCWDHDFLTAENARLAPRGLPYLFAYADQTRAVAGPLCRGRDGACYACHFERRAAHGRAGRAVEDWLTTSTPASLAPARADPSPVVATAAATNAVALMIAHLSGMEHTAPLGIIREQELLSGTFEAGILLRAPRCAVCGTRPDFAPGAPLRTGRLTWEAAERDVND